MIVDVFLAMWGMLMFLYLVRNNSILVLMNIFVDASVIRALAGPWKSMIFFSRFSRPGKFLKTDMVLESPWICVWRSLKVLELLEIYCELIWFFHTLQCHRQRSALLGCGGGHPLSENPTSSAPSVAWFSRLHLCILRMVLESPRKVLEFDFDKWARTLCYVQWL